MFEFFIKQKKEGSKYEKFKKHDSLDLISSDEIVVVVFGITIFGWFQSYEIVFILVVVVWYWLKIRYLERKIVEKEKDIYNILFENANNSEMTQEFLERKTKHDCEPMRYDLKQLQNKREFFVDKFVVINFFGFNTIICEKIKCQK